MNWHTQQSFFLCKIHLTWESRFIFFQFFFYSFEFKCSKWLSSLFKWWCDAWCMMVQLMMMIRLRNTEYSVFFFNLFFFLYSRHIYTPEKKCIWYDTSDPGNDPKKKKHWAIERMREKYNVIFQKHGFRQFMVVVVVSRSVCLSDNVMWYLGKKKI